MSKILIIEDEEAIADLEKDYLELSGFEVEIEHRGDVGLKRALTEDFNLVILDLMLPEMNGFDICREIRAQKNTPIIMVSAKKDDIDKIRGLGLGADDYMTKPFSPSELVARVKAHLARYERLIGSGVQENDIIEIRGIKIDKTARRVWVNGEEKNFTTKEFDLLTFLAQNPNRVFTKDELFREIWDMESVGDIATVTVHIKKIREKIEFNTAKPHYTRKQWFFPAKQWIYQDLKVPKIQQKTRVLCASFLRCPDRFWLLNINARHQPVELPPCKIPDFGFIPGPPVRSLGGQSFVYHNDPVRLF